MIISPSFKNIFATVIFLTAVSLSQNSFAQEPAQAQESAQAENVVEQEAPAEPTPTEPMAVETLTGDPLVEDMVRRILKDEPDVKTNQIPSLFFTSWELGLIQDARKGLVTRAPTDYELDKSLRDAENGTRPPMGPRELGIGGIIYTSSNDWTVWLNGQKITPDRLPPEILDIRVGKDYVRMKWFDAYTNQIFPVKIKTHQRFNIDARIFLPG